MNKTQKRAKWIKTNAERIEAHRTPDSGETKRNGGYQYNGARRADQSGGGYGWWARALRAAGIRSDAHNYWSGAAPTPSTSINKGIADYIRDNASDEIK